MKFESILIIAPPGGGKSTHSTRLAQAGGYFHKSSGDCLRQIAEKDQSSLGDRVRADQAANRFTADKDLKEVIYQALVREIIMENFCPSSQYLLPDGFPRNETQVKLLDFLAVKQVLYITNLDQDILASRIQGRALQAQLAGVPARLEDLDHDKIRKRLSDYYELTVPVLKQYDSKIIQAIDGSLALYEVSTQIDKIILRK